jgi:hypothetical protein
MSNHMMTPISQEILDEYDVEVIEPQPVPTRKVIYSGEGRVAHNEKRKSRRKIANKSRAKNRK